jgi:integrase
MQAARANLVLTRFRIPKRQTTVAVDEGRITRHINPLIGSIRARDLTRADVQKMVDQITQGRTKGVYKGKPRGKAVVSGGCSTAARAASLLGGIYSWSEKRGLVTGLNPVRGVETGRYLPRDRIVSASELRALGTAMQELSRDVPDAVAALRLIALTGVRREEACGLQWNEIDELGHCLRLCETKTGKSVRPIGTPAIDILRALPRRSDIWVFTNETDTGSADLKKAIARIFDRAGLQDARSHDLRRTFASAAADEGYSDATIAALLGHAQRGVTARHYIRRPDEALVAAANRTAIRIVSQLDGRIAEVVPLQYVERRLGPGQRSN